MFPTLDKELSGLGRLFLDATADVTRVVPPDVPDDELPAVYVGAGVVFNGETTVVLRRTGSAVDGEDQNSFKHP